MKHEAGVVPVIEFADLLDQAMKATQPPEADGGCASNGAAPPALSLDLTADRYDELEGERYAAARLNRPGCKRSPVVTLRPYAAGRRVSPFTRVFLLEVLAWIIVTAIFAGLVLLAFDELLPEDNTPPATPNTAPSSPLPPRTYDGPGSPTRGEGPDPFVPSARLLPDALSGACGWVFDRSPRAARTDASDAGALPPTPTAARAAADAGELSPRPIDRICSGAVGCFLTREP